MIRARFGLIVVSILFAFFCILLPVYAQQADPADEAALRKATSRLCHARVVMLGEIATHGDGHTLGFKVNLVEHLIDRCGFDSILFEANQYEFLHLEQHLRSRQPVTPDDLLTAVGGLWKFYREFQPLASFLVERVQTGRVSLGGLDDQLGQFGQAYANDLMLGEFTGLLPEPGRQNCATAFRRRVYGDYPEAPYSKSDQVRLKACLDQVQVAADADSSTAGSARVERQQMIVATRRWIDRDFDASRDTVANRDTSMYQTFEWWKLQHPKSRKVIVWAATVHIAKQVPPNWSGHTGSNFGSLVHRKYGRHAVALGFSALTGSYRQAKGKFPPLPVAPKDSIEIHILRARSGETAYVDSGELQKLGKRPAAFFYHRYQDLNWAKFLDGAIVFQREYPPADIRR